MPPRRHVRALALGFLFFLGCGPVAYLKEVSGSAATALAQAKSDGAEKFAPVRVHQSQLVLRQGTRRRGPRPFSECHRLGPPQPGLFGPGIGLGQIRAGQAHRGTSQTKPELRGALSVAPWCLRLPVLSLALASVVSCAGSDLALRLGDVRQDLAIARSQGAYRCAPRELAAGESNAEFAEREFDAGEYFAAKDYLESAQASAKAALRLSSDERLCPKVRSRWLVRIAPNPAPDPLADSDGDGIPDLQDRVRPSRKTKTGLKMKTDVPIPTTTRTASWTSTTSVQTNPRISMGSRTKTGAPTPTTTRTASPTQATAVRTSLVQPRTTVAR